MIILPWADEATFFHNSYLSINVMNTELSEELEITGINMD